RPSSRKMPQNSGEATMRTAHAGRGGAIMGVGTDAMATILPWTARSRACGDEDGNGLARACKGEGKPFQRNGAPQRPPITLPSDYSVWQSYNCGENALSKKSYGGQNHNLATVSLCVGTAGLR